MEPLPQLTLADYIANCIHSVVAADCVPGALRRRDCDLARAVTIAAAEGEREAHAYLVELAKKAGQGAYAGREGGGGAAES